MKICEVNLEYMKSKAAKLMLELLGDFPPNQWQPMDTAPKYKFILIKIPCTDAHLDNYIYTGIVQEDHIEIFGLEGEYHFNAGECAGWMPRPE